MTKLRIIVNGKEISFSQDEFRYAKKRHSLQELNRQKETLLQGLLLIARTLKRDALYKS